MEIRKIGTTLLNWSASINKSAVYPLHKLIPGSKNDGNGRGYFKINTPGQIVIDINGQMDDHNAAYQPFIPYGRMPHQPDGTETPVHSIAFYANPSQSSRTDRLIPPDPATYDTLAFAPGIHNIGPAFTIHKMKSYYIPGDAILYGSLSNRLTGLTQAEIDSEFPTIGFRIKVYGYGSLCGMQTPSPAVNGDTRYESSPPTPGLPEALNPEYPEWNAWPETGDDLSRKRTTTGIDFLDSHDFTLTGVNVIDPANFNLRSTGDGGNCLTSWVKLHSWRVSGDGCNVAALRPAVSNAGYSKFELSPYIGRLANILFL